MRLLQYTATTGFTLTDDLSPGKLPPYAILSHTWGPPTEEVIYDDIKNRTEKTKAGYNKLVFCAKQATRDGLRYFWVDTCCINKSNHSELSKAIVSMFRWYQTASRCYVYLSDVSAQNTDRSVWSETLRKSRWFTRGWTLQELLAPSSVEFFSDDDVRLGDKNSLGQLIHDVTGISISAIQGGNLLDFGVEDRFRWAESRKTTEPEDIVYCLWGIFDVSLPVIYGEGKEKARRRLESAIASAHTISTAAGQRKRPFLVPFERNPAFTGREAETKRLRQMTRPKQHTVKVAITGLGGVGKTQLALDFVFQRQKEFPDCAVFWVPSVSHETIEQAYRKAAQELGILAQDDDNANLQERLKDYWSRVENGRWALVFDNVDDISLWEERGLINCLPRNELGTILFTSRSNKIAVRLARSNVINLSNMDEESSRHLLHNYLIHKDLLDCMQDTTTLLDELTSLPLALVQAATYINMNTITIREYVELLSEQEEDVVELLSEGFDDAWRYGDVPKPVATTWLISFTQIQQHHPLAADYLSFMACVDSKDIPRSLLPAGSSRKAEMDAIGTLTAYSFISRQAPNNMFTMHRLVHIATRNWLRNNKTLAAWTDQTIEKLAKTLQEADVQDRSVWRSYMPHAYYELKLHAGLVKYMSPLFNLQWGYQKCLNYDGRYDEAEQVQMELFEVTKESLDLNHPDTLASMANLASTYRNQGRWDKAEELFVQVMETRKTKLGPDHPDTLTSMGNLASTYRNQGRWDKAEELEVQVMETFKTKLGPDHPHTLTSMNNLACTWKRQGQHIKALKLMSDCAESRQRVIGSNHPDTLSSIQHLNEWG